MKPERDNLHRIIIEIPCRFGQEQQMYHRQVNLSACGVVFNVMPEMRANFNEGERYTFSFEIQKKHFELDAHVVKKEQMQGLTLAAAQFLHTDDNVFEQLDHIIMGMGGYLKHDLDKKQAYLTRFAPELATKCAIKTTPEKAEAGSSLRENQTIDTPNLNAIDIQDLKSLEMPDLSSIDDMFKNFGQ